MRRKKQQDSALRHQKNFNIKKNLALVLKKFARVLFYVFQTNLNKAVDILCKLSEWIRNIKMIEYFNTKKTWMRILLTQKTEEPKCNKGNFTPPTHTHTHTHTHTYKE